MRRRVHSSEQIYTSFPQPVISPLPPVFLLSTVFLLLSIKNINILLTIIKASNRKEKKIWKGKFGEDKMAFLSPLVVSFDAWGLKKKKKKKKRY